MRIGLAALAGISLLLGSPAVADLRVIRISKDGLPYDISPNNYTNSPSNYDNSSSNYDNSSSNYDNSPSNYDNSSSNYDNRLSGDRKLLGPSGRPIGYYVFSKKGVLNFYNRSGRLAYMPSGGKTQSIFASSGSEWCGTIGQIDGEAVVGMTPSCLLRFMIDQ